MDKLMDSPWFLRFIALFLAVILFISIKAEEGKVNGTTPGDQLEMIRDIPVAIFYDNENLVVSGVPETVNMTIEGPTNIVQTTLLLKDFSLFVDLNTLTMGSHTIEIQHENLSPKLNVRFDPATIDIVIEEKITQSFRVDAELNDRLLAEDFHVVKMEVEPSTVEITGAKSVIESISFVKVTATSEEGLNKSFEQKARVRVLDKDLNKLGVVISPEEVTVKVDVAEYAKEVPVVLKTRGVPPLGVGIDSLTPVETKITLTGPRKVLEDIDEFIVEVDVSKVTDSTTIDIELKKPGNVSSISFDKIKVKIEATVSEVEEEDEEEVAFSDLSDEETQTIGTKTFNNTQIIIQGLNNKYKSTFLKPVSGLVTLTIKAEPDRIDALESSDFSVYINAERTTETGEQVFTVSVDGPEEVSWLLSEDEVTVQIELV
ncbi:CdaR family protein [Sporosarcina sp. CAU 1771]